MPNSTENISKAEIPDKETLQASLPTTTDPNRKLNDIPAEHKDFDLGKALTLRLANKNSYQEIADLMNCPKATVYYRLSKFDRLIADPHATQGYDTNRANLLTSIEMEVALKILDGESLQKSTANQLGYLLKIVNEARRLELDKSTANVSHHVMTTDINELQRELDAIEAEKCGN